MIFPRTVVETDYDIPKIENLLKILSVEVYHNNNQQMQLAQEATKTDSIASKAIVGLVLELKKVF